MLVHSLQRTEFLVQPFLVGPKPNQIVFRRVAHHADGIAAAFHRLDGFLIQTAQENYPLSV
jgi:hypothetical protein